MKYRIAKILLLFLLVLASACTSSFIGIQKLYPPDDLVVDGHSEWSGRYYKERIEVFKNDPLNKGEIVFLGNSITEQGGDWSLRLGIENVRNRGIAADLTNGVLERLGEICHAKPKAVFLLIGINDIYNWHHGRGNPPPPPKHVGNNILKIAEKIHKGTPKTKIYVQTVLPTDFEPVKEAILTVNSMIRSHEATGHYHVIDLYPEFTDSLGLIRPELTKDGVHLTDEGYAIWVKMLESVISDEL